MSELLVVTGPPGAGKSTVAQLLVDRFERSVLVEGDAFFGFLRNGHIDPWLVESHAQNIVVTEAAAAAAGHFASGGFATIYDGVVGPWFLDTFVAATGLDQVDYVILLPSIEQCVERVQTRPGHGFSDEAATRHMHQQFLGAEIDERHVFADPHGEPGEVVDQILAARRDGALTWHPSGPAPFALPGRPG